MAIESRVQHKSGSGRVQSSVQHQDAQNSGGGKVDSRSQVKPGSSSINARVQRQNKGGGSILSSIMGKP